MSNVRKTVLAGAALAVALGAAFPAGAELIEDRTNFRGVPVRYGIGTTRLDGMGLSISARDENNEINVFDFGDNPAGLLLDRDAWSVDARMAHQEYTERGDAVDGFDVKGNTYSLLASYRKSGYHAFAGGYDFKETTVRETGVPRTDFENTQYRLLYNRQFSRLSVGLEFRFQNETETLVNPRRLYFINHETNAYVGILGVSVPVNDMITVAGRGDLRRATVDGTAESDSHLDQFDWNRPLGSGDIQGFLDHPRVNGAVSIGRAEGAGEEIVAIGWSQLFFFNPSTDFVRFSRETFTEKTDTDRISTRWEYAAVPGQVTVVGSYRDESSGTTTTSEPTVSGSRQSSSVSFDKSDLGLGGNILLLEQRLFVGGEFHREEFEFSDLDELEGFTKKRSISSFRFGSEFLLLESLVVRGGLGFFSEDRTESSVDPGYVAGPTGSYSSSTASFGLGLVPSGGVVQLDAAYTAGLSSDLDISQNQFSLYTRILF